MHSHSFSLLRLLADGQFRSGEEMAGRLGISRATVSQALKQVEEAGVELYRVRGRGYQLAEPIEWLDAGLIRSRLKPAARQFPLHIADALESTNAELMARAAGGADSGTCLVAEWQSRGRGRRGRTWIAGLGGSLTFSLLWRFNQGAGYLGGLSLAVGVALVRALREQGIAGAGLKWPNDLVHNYHKLAGILIELQGDVLGPSAAVIGVGLNLRLPHSLRGSIDQAVTDLDTLAGDVSRNHLFAALLNHLADVLAEFERNGFTSLREEWSAHHVYHGKGVNLLHPGGRATHGVVAGVEADGTLLLQTPAGIERVSAGEISLRAA
jgi:BirA family biotin operon repressor/biotin-[acetyl-CoA-carboxylase] ligase